MKQTASSTGLTHDWQERTNFAFPMAAAAIEDSFHRKLPVQRSQLVDWMAKH
jgi:hypothetical protein